MKIGNLKIGLKHKPFIVAEMSGNHNQSIKNAYKIIDKGVESGVSAVKLQTYTADTLTIKSSKKNFVIKDNKSLWNNQSLYDLYNKAHTPWNWHKKIFDYCDKKKILCFSSPFDSSAVDFLLNLNVPAFKIASFEINNIPLIEKIAKTKKPMIISTGMATLKEIKETVNICRVNGCNKIILLKCTSTYPSSPDDSNISTISYLRDKFDCEVGISDHTKGIGVAIAAISYGATFIEKHLTLDRNDGGVDSVFSMEPNEMKLLVDESLKAWRSIGKITFGPSKSEKKSMMFRKSIYIISNIKKEEKFSENNLKIIRPGNGLEPKYYKKILGKKALKNLKKDTPLKENYIKYFKKK